jgi:drug/metabolite transporter (DMT)-like permease
MLLLVLFGVFNGMAHLMFARAFALAPVSVLAPFEYSPLLIGGVIGFLIWAEVPGWTTLAGACLVVAAGLYNVYREQVRRAAERTGAFSSQANSLGDSENATKNTMKEGA